MSTIYYLSAILLLWVELQWLLSPAKKTEESNNFFELKEQYEKLEWREYPESYKSLIKSKTYLVVLLAWLFCGLFTAQWLVFLAYLCFSFFIIAPLAKVTRYTKLFTIIHWLGSLVGFAFGVFVIINHYHLKIDLTSWFLSLFK